MSRNHKMNGPRQQIEEIDESLPPFVAAVRPHLHDITLSSLTMLIHD
jgi:hypothetical protein